MKCKKTLMQTSCIMMSMIFSSPILASDEGQFCPGYADVETVKKLLHKNVSHSEAWNVIRKQSPNFQKKAEKYHDQLFDYCMKHYKEIIR